MMKPSLGALLAGVLVLGGLRGDVRAQEKDPGPALAALLKDKNVEVRRSAAFVLKFLPQVDAAVTNLVEALRDPDEIVRNNASDALVLIAPRYSVPPLTAALREKSPQLKQLAATTLGRIRRFTDEAIPDLILLLKDNDPDVREAASGAIKNILGTRHAY